MLVSQAHTINQYKNLKRRDELLKVKVVLDGLSLNIYY